MSERFSVKTVDFARNVFTFVTLRFRTKDIIEQLIIFAQHLAVKIGFKKTSQATLLFIKMSSVDLFSLKKKTKQKNIIIKREK